MNLTAHPAADLFPLLTGDTYESFKADIAERGLLEPIWLYEGQILDGRNRYRACVELGIEPQFREYTGNSPVAFVWSLNGTRRHMTPSQLGVVAHKMMPHLREEARKRQAAGGEKGREVRYDAGLASKDAKPDFRPTGNKAAQEAAKIVGVSPATVERIEYVAKRDPALLPKIESGEVTATQAVEIVKAAGSPAPTPEKKTAARAERAKRAEQIRVMAEEGHRGEQIAAELGINVPYVRKLAREEGITLPEFRFGKTARIKTDRVIGETVNSLIGLNGGLQVVRDSIGSIDPQQASEWAEAISEPLKSLNWLSKKLKEIANGN